MCGLCSGCFPATSAILGQCSDAIFRGGFVSSTVGSLDAWLCGDEVLVLTVLFGFTRTVRPNALSFLHGLVLVFAYDSVVCVC